MAQPRGCVQAFSQSAPRGCCAPPPGGYQFASSAYLRRNCVSNTWHMGGLHLVMLQMFSFYLGKKKNALLLSRNNMHFY